MLYCVREISQVVKDIRNLLFILTSVTKKQVSPQKDEMKASINPGFIVHSVITASVCHNTMYVKICIKR